MEEKGAPMRKRRAVVVLMAVMIILACNFPGIGVTGAVETATAALEAASPTLAPSATVAAVATVCTPQITANTAANVRSGPGTGYNIVGSLNPNQSATIDGKNTEGTWWYIVYATAPGGHGWVAASTSTATCVSGPIAVVVPPATSTPKVELGVTNVSVSVDPKEILIGGCMGPLQQSTVVANITVNGPITLQWHFETDQHGSLGNHSLSFDNAGSKQVSEKFTPLVEAGTFTVQIVIDNMDLGGMDFRAKYKIVC
jgi:uncharacterized protein YraI